MRCNLQSWHPRTHKSAVSLPPGSHALTNGACMCMDMHSYPRCQEQQEIMWMINAANCCYRINTAAICSNLMQASTILTAAQIQHVPANWAISAHGKKETHPIRCACQARCGCYGGAQEGGLLSAHRCACRQHHTTGVGCYLSPGMGCGQWHMESGADGTPAAFSAHRCACR